MLHCLYYSNIPMKLTGRAFVRIGKKINHPCPQLLDLYYPKTSSKTDLKLYLRSIYQWTLELVPDSQIVSEK